MRTIRSFEYSPASVTAARRFANAVLQGAPAEARDAVALMVSELASNCIRHADTGFDLTISETTEEIRVEATDRGSGEPRMRNPGPTDPSGRGLQIIDMLSGTWGIDHPAGRGKTVWFTLPVHAPGAVGGSPA